MNRYSFYRTLTLQLQTRIVEETYLFVGYHINSSGGISCCLPLKSGWKYFKQQLFVSSM